MQTSRLSGLQSSQLFAARDPPENEAFSTGGRGVGAWLWYGVSGLNMSCPSRCIRSKLAALPIRPTPMAGPYPPELFSDPLPCCLRSWV